jgi:transcription elongation factor Elf1
MDKNTCPHCGKQNTNLLDNITKSHVEIRECYDCGKTYEVKLTRYALEFTGTHYAWAVDEEEAKKKWEDTDFGPAENLDITEVRIAG